MRVKYQHHCVADLAWALSSPPVLRYQNTACQWFADAWYLEQYRQLDSKLRQLDRNPAELQKQLAAQKDQRLGNYFETLWAYALQLSPRYQLLERNLQFHAGERTIGEMDFIVLDKVSGRHAHWELAIKFYLGVGDTVKQNAWHGPGKKDRLDLKVDHLLSRQTELSHHPAVRDELAQRGIVIDDCAVILKGRLFYPWQQRGRERHPEAANSTHPIGHWLSRDQFEHAFSPDARFLPLIRGGWLSRNPMNRLFDGYTVAGLMRLVEQGACRLPLHVAQLQGESEDERLFIVDDNWLPPET
ncbi:MAG: DUF1853 family protein [Gammaproteobacteria bacterium]|nr:DUF1853 family protein [Gammaproteobacteria bacterium]